jgi:hypothetical protein
MSDSTTELGLQLAVDADDSADYLTIGLRQSLQSIDGLYSQATGHTHSGPHQGGLLAAAAFGGPFDLPDWFRSTGQRTGFPNSAQGIEMYWSGVAGILQAYDRGANQYRDLMLEGSTIHLAHAGTDALVIDGSGNVNIANSLTVTGTLNATGTTALTGAATLSSTLNVTGQTTLNATQVNGTLTSSGLQVNGAGAVTGALTVNGLVTGGGLQVSGNGTLTGTLNVGGNLTGNGSVAAGPSVATSAGDLSANRGGGQGFLFLGDVNHRLEYNAANYVLRNGGLSCDWLATNTAARNDSYALTLPNTAGTDHTGKAIATGYDSYSAARGKQDITPIAEPLAIVTHPNVHGVTYQPLGGGPDMVGFVAEDWHAVLPAVVGLDEDGNPQALDYGRIGAVTFQAVKQLAAQVQALQEQLQALQAAQEGQQTT